MLYYTLLYELSKRCNISLLSRLTCLCASTLTYATLKFEHVNALSTAACMRLSATASGYPLNLSLSY